MKLEHSQINPVGVLNAKRAASNALTGARAFPPRIRPIAETGLRLPRLRYPRPRSRAALCADHCHAEVRETEQVHETAHETVPFVYPLRRVNVLALVRDVRSEIASWGICSCIGMQGLES